jgi:hypothetical protein
MSTGAEVSRHNCSLVTNFVAVGHGDALRAVESAEPVAASAWLLRSYIPELMCQYPDEPPLPHARALADFCAPNGLRPSRERTAPSYACFALTDEQGRCQYGHCLTVHAPLPASTPVHMDGGGGGGGGGGEVCDTVGTLSGDAPAFAPRCLCLLSPSHFPLAFKASLLALQGMVEASVSAPLAVAVETALMHLVDNVPRPVRGSPAVRAYSVLCYAMRCDAMLCYARASASYRMRRSLASYGQVRFRLAAAAPALHVVCSPPEARPYY